MKSSYIHYSNFGHSMRPEVADASGYIAYRETFYDLPDSEWTPAERWIALEELRMEAE